MSLLCSRDTIIHAKNIFSKFVICLDFYVILCCAFKNIYVIEFINLFLYHMWILSHGRKCFPHQTGIISLYIESL